YSPVPVYPLDILGAETQGMIGYLVEQELANRLPPDQLLATLLTMIEVDPEDPAFAEPTKPIGPIYTPVQAGALERSRRWTFRPDGDSLRRVVPSPPPLRILELRQIVGLLGAGCVVICAGGGGIPVARYVDGALRGVEAVIDKDHASGLLAHGVDAEVLVMATDTPGVYLGFGSPDQRLITEAHPDALAEHSDEFAAGSMLPKVEAACDFARKTRRRAVIGQLSEIDRLVAGTAGTTILTDATGITTVPAPPPRQVGPEDASRRHPG
ncbi:MAG TPA: hypothetical protein VL068_04350, partial [Microthrixaceae bacterium]|nr:hypothetical protein [Microthrixaceae bacterium]